MFDTLSATAGRIVAAAGAALRNLYGGVGAEGTPSLPDPDTRVLRSAAYRRLRPVIVAHGLENQTITAIKLLHTTVFAGLMGLVLLITASGIRNRFTRRTGLALLTIVGEGSVLALNKGRCPLTVVVEDLGAEHGSVSDIFLPDWFAHRIPHISSGLIGLGLAVAALRRLANR